MARRLFWRWNDANRLSSAIFRILPGSGIADMKLFSLRPILRICIRNGVKGPLRVFLSDRHVGNANYLPSAPSSPNIGASP